LVDLIKFIVLCLYGVWIFITIHACQYAIIFKRFIILKL